MSELEKIIWTAGATIIGGVVILVVGQIIIRFFIEPLQEYRRTEAAIIHALTMYRDVLSDLGATQMEVRREASKEFRRLAGHLTSSYSAVPWPRMLRLPTTDRLTDALDALLSLSDNVLRILQGQRTWRLAKSSFSLSTQSDSEKAPSGDDPAGKEGVNSLTNK